MKLLSVGMDIRFNNKRPRDNTGAFDPYSKTCDDDFEVCCKGLELQRGFFLKGNKQIS